MNMRMRNTKPGLWEKIAAIPRWMWLFIGMGVLFMALVPAVGLARMTTSSSTYCLTCHATGDTPDKSVSSLVHPDLQKVSCVDCHAKSHQIVYEGYVKGFMAEPERVGPNCVGCHPATVKTNEQKDFNYNFLNIKISHQSHLERGATCVTCHSNIAHDLNPVPTNRPGMDTCYSCHAKTDSCVKCHGQQIPQKPLPPPAPPSADMLGDGRVYYLRICTACHGAKGNQVEGVTLNSREYLEKKGVENLAKSIFNGKGNMHAFSQKKGGHLNEDQIHAILAYLEEEAVGKTAPNPDTLYKRYCITCHGADGNKVAGVLLTTPQYWEQQEIDRAFISVQGGKSGMPPFGKGEGGNLSKQELMALLQYLRDKAGPIAKKPAAVETPVLPDGKPLFDKNCAMCHGANGSQLPMANLGSPDYLKQKGTAALIKGTGEGKGGMPAYSKDKGGQLTALEIQAIIAYLEKEAKIEGSSVAQPPVTSSLPDGKPIYDKTCAMCHGANGNQLPMASLGSADYLKQKGTDGLIKVTGEGKGGMPAYSKDKGGQLTSLEIQAVIAYLEKGAK